MAFQLRYDVFRIVELRDGCVYKTAMVCSIWLDCKPRSRQELNAIAKEHGGDVLASTLDSRILKGVKSCP